MNLSKLTLAITAALSAGASYNAYAIELYVDTHTKQIYAEPGPGRELMGSFEKVGEAAASQSTPSSSPSSTDDISAIKQDLELKSNEIAALKEHAKEAEEFKVKLDDGIEFKSKDGNFKAAINGRMQVDSQVNVTDGVNPGLSGTPIATTNQLGDGVGIRRARLGVEGTFFHDYDYKFEYDFTRGNGTIGAGVTDAFLRWNYDKAFSIKVGSFKEPFSLEEATSNRYLTFLERNMIVNTFIDNPNTYKVGIGANYSQERYQIATSFQTEPVGANPSGSTSSASSINTNGGSNRNNGSGDTGWEANGRVSGMPWMESKTKFWHVGASGSYVKVNNNYGVDKTDPNNPKNSLASGGFSFVSALNNNVDRTNILNTGNLTNLKNGREIDHFTRFGAETAFVYGPWSAQAEYIQTNVSGKGYSGETLDGYYGYVSYFLTGESRAYKSKTGAWDRLKPNRNFDFHNGGWGAWEVAAGYDYIDLNDGVIQGGRASTAKFGLNWYPNSHFRVMGNFVHVLDLNYATGKAVRGFNNADLDMFEMRAQVDF